MMNAELDCLYRQPLTCDKIRTGQADVEAAVARLMARMDSTSKVLKSVPGDSYQVAFKLAA
jgi:hypothetical protein